jgi:lipopolysaccharide transport system ATP-binding protein
VVQYGPVDAVVAAYHDLLYGSGKTGLLGDAKPFKKNEGATLETENIAQESELRTFLEGDGEPLFRRFPYYNPYERRIGNGGAEIVDFLVAANGELHFNVLSGSETLTVYLKVRFNRRVDMPRIGWAIVTSEGIVIAGSNTVMLNIPLASAQAGETWVYAVKMKPNFCGGQYFLTAGVGECDKVGACDGDEWTYFDVRRSVCHLSVATSGRATGFVEVPFSCAVLHGPLNKALSLS